MRVPTQHRKAKVQLLALYASWTESEGGDLETGTVAIDEQGTDEDTDSEEGGDDASKSEGGCRFGCIKCFVEKWVLEPVVRELEKGSTMEKRMLGLIWYVILLCVLAAVYYSR